MKIWLHFWQIDLRLLNQSGRKKSTHALKKVHTPQNGHAQQITRTKNYAYKIFEPENFYEPKFLYRNNFDGVYFCVVCSFCVVCVHFVLCVSDLTAYVRVNFYKILFRYSY